MTLRQASDLDQKLPKMTKEQAKIVTAGVLEELKRYVEDSLQRVTDRTKVDPSGLIKQYTQKIYIVYVAPSGGHKGTYYWYNMGIYQYTSTRSGMVADYYSKLSGNYDSYLLFSNDALGDAFAHLLPKKLTGKPKATRNIDVVDMVYQLTNSYVNML